MVVEEIIPVCIAGLPLTIGEKQIRKELIEPLDLNVTDIFIDKRRDGFVSTTEYNYAKCYLNVKTKTAIKKICAIIHKSDFSRKTNLNSVKPIALIPVSVAEICKNTGSNVIEDEESKETVSNLDENNDRKRKLKSKDIREFDTDFEERTVNKKDKLDQSEETETKADELIAPKKEEEDLSNCVYLALTGLEEKSTQESVKQLFSETGNEAKKVYFDNSGEKLKAFVLSPVSAGAGLKRFCAFLCKELTAKAGSKINVKHVETIPNYLTSKNSFSEHKSEGSSDYDRNRNDQSKHEKRWGWVEKSENGNRGFKSEHNDFNSYENSNYNNDSYKRSYDDNYENESNKYSQDFREKRGYNNGPKVYSTKPYKPIIYYDPTNPEHKCYELDYESDSEKKIDDKEKLENGQEKMNEISDIERTEKLKSVLTEAKASGFSFGFDTSNNTSENGKIDDSKIGEDLEAKIKAKIQQPKLMFTLPSLDELRNVNFYNPKKNEEIVALSRSSKKKTAKSSGFKNRPKNLPQKKVKTEPKDKIP